MKNHKSISKAELANKLADIVFNVSRRISQDYQTEYKHLDSFDFLIANTILSDLLKGVDSSFINTLIRDKERQEILQFVQTITPEIWEQAKISLERKCAVRSKD